MQAVVYHGEALLVGHRIVFLNHFCCQGVEDLQLRYTLVCGVAVVKCFILYCPTSQNMNPLYIKANQINCFVTSDVFSAA
jgi:hypothetical protein